MAKAKSKTPRAPSPGKQGMVGGKPVTHIMVKQMPKTRKTKGC